MKIKRYTQPSWLATYLGVIIAGVFISWLNDCRTTAEGIGLAWTYTGTYGCLVEVSEGEWVNLREYLERDTP